MSEIRSDMVGKIPVLGDLVAFNPPSYKGLLIRPILNFSTSGLPIVDMNSDNQLGKYQSRIKSIKTGFVIVIREDNEKEA